MYAKETRKRLYMGHCLKRIILEQLKVLDVPKDKRPNVEGKIILDPTCGGRTIWFNKEHPKVLYTDNRRLNGTKARPKFNIDPDLIMDFRSMDLPENHFKLIVWDPPHLFNLGKNSEVGLKYGVLSHHWEDDIKRGFRELWRILAEYGVLIFKWNERDIPISQVLKCFDKEPLFGHTMRSKTRTYWMAFMKFPEEVPGP